MRKEIKLIFMMVIVILLCDCKRETIKYSYDTIKLQKKLILDEAKRNLRTPIRKKCSEYLGLKISTDKSTYTAGEEIWLNIEVENTSNVCVAYCNSIRFGENFSISIRNITTGKDVDTGILIEYPPVTVEDFKVLKPNESSKRKMNLTANKSLLKGEYDPLFKIAEEGIYEIFIAYDSAEKMYFNKKELGSIICDGVPLPYNKVLECYLQSNITRIIISDKLNE